MKIPILNNSKGVVFAISLIASFVLTIFSSGYMVSMASELRTSKRFHDSTQAFWLSEAGLATYIKNPTMLDGGTQTLNFPMGTVTMSKDDSSGPRKVRIAANSNDSQRAIQATFEAGIPDPFFNTLTAGGNIGLAGSTLTVNGLAKMTGEYIEQPGSVSVFENLTENVDSALTTLHYPDADNNGTADELNDFKKFYQDLAATYAEDEVVYIKSDGRVIITPSSEYNGKKLIFVEGTSEDDDDDDHSGSVSIRYGVSPAENQDITVVATGQVSYTHSMQPQNSKLNIISWKDYVEFCDPVVSHCRQAGVIYTHGTARLNYASRVSHSTGNLIAN